MKDVSKVEKKRKKTGGRTKGTPNKKTLVLLDELGDFNPVKELKNLFKITDDEDIKLKICLDLMKYIYPQRKAVEHTVDTEDTNTRELFLAHLRNLPNAD